MGRFGIHRGFDWAFLAGLALATSFANGNVAILWIPGGLAPASRRGECIRSYGVTELALEYRTTA